MLAVVVAHGAAAPSLRLAGLGLALRAVLELQAVGATTVHLKFAGAAELVTKLQNDGRITAGLVVGCDQLPADTLLLVHGYDKIVPRMVLQKLAAVTQPQQAACDGDLLGPARLLASQLNDRSGVALLQLDAWSVDVSTAAGQRQAVKRLFDQCRKPVDGIVSRHLNRHVSLFVSRLLVDTPITPNGMTAVTMLFAVAAAAFAWRGDYLSTAVAGVLMQLNSILDGCDGELARVRHQGSKLGQWLDTIGDDASNVVFWAALGVGALTLPLHGWWLAWCGWIGAAANGLAALFNYAVLVKLGSGDFYALDDQHSEPSNGAFARVASKLAVLFKQDFFLFAAMCLALAGVLHYALVVVAVGAIITLVNSAVGAIRFFRRAKQ